MTCIIGVEHNGVVYMGADSILVDGWWRDVMAGTKLFQRDGMLFGFAGSPRMAQIIEHLMDSPKRQEAGQPDEAYLIQSVIEPMREALKTFGYASIENSREAGANVMIGYRGHLYTIQDNYQLCRSAMQFTALGVGAPYALGALAALLGPVAVWDRRNLEAGILEALEVAGTLCIGVAWPFVVEKIDFIEQSLVEVVAASAPVINREAFFRS